MLLVPVILAGIFSLPFLSSSINGSSSTVTIDSTGQLETNSVTAKSGSARDIQAAVNLIASAGGGNVYIPSGTFNFVNVGEWSSGGNPVVTVPAGVNIFGAPTQRDANGQVVQWNTVLVMPWDVPDQGDLGGPWFFFTGNGGSYPYEDDTQQTGKSFRFSDIMLEGYRYLNPSSTTFGPCGIIVNEVKKFRIDHCYFRDITAGAIWVGWYAPNSAGHACHSNGVIDHCRLINTNGIPGPDVSQATVGYGVAVYRVNSDFWDTNTWNVVGHHTDYTTFIEDCYFEKWRHSVCGGHGAHYVFRHNTINNDFGFGSLDGHGTYVYVGTRAMETYENTFTNCLSGYGRTTVFHRGGAAAYFNNTADSSYSLFVEMVNEGSVSMCFPHDVYIWNNVFPGGSLYSTSGPVLGTDFFLSAMPNYTPYPYPHPLTLTAP